MNNNNNKMKNSLPYVILFGVIAFVLLTLGLHGSDVKELTSGELLKELKNNNVTEITITPNSNESVYYVEGKLEGYKENESFKTKIITEEIVNVIEYVESNDIEEYVTESDPGSLQNASAHITPPSERILRLYTPTLLQWLQTP